MKTIATSLLCGLLAGLPASAGGLNGTAHSHAAYGLGAHHLPLPVPTHVRLGVEPSGRFNILVTPNLLTQRQALGIAARRAAGHCEAARTGVPARIDVIARYARSDIGSWGFSGTCS